MKSSHDDSAPLTNAQKMINALDALLELRDPEHKVSNGARIIEQLRKLQEAYHALDDESKVIIDAHLQKTNPRLFRALEKKGSKISKPFELAGEVHETLPDELRKLIALNPVLTAIPSHPLPEEESGMPDTGTMVVNSGMTQSNQLSDALASAGRQMDPNIYAMFATSNPDALPSSDPLTAVIQSLENLMKTKTHKDDVLQQAKKHGVSKPKGFDNAYRDTLLREHKILDTHKEIFKQVLQNPSNQKQLTQIIEKLEKEVQTVPEIMKLTAEISDLIDKHLIDSVKSTQHANTPRYLE